MDFILDIHNHTIASGHAYSTITEYAAAAKKEGLELIAITDHAPAMPGSTGEMYFLNFKVIPDEIEGVKIMMGTELNILGKDGEVDLKEGLIRNLCPVIASFHTPTFNFSKDGMKDSEKKSEITEAILNVMENKNVDIIGHLGDPRYPFDIEATVKKSLETGTLIEINNSSLKPDSFRYGSRSNMLEIVKCCKKHSCPIVLGTDAHFAADTGKFDDTNALLREACFSTDLIANINVSYFFELLKGAEHE